MKNTIKDKQNWLDVTQKTVRELHKNQSITLHQKSWIVLFEQDLHPIDAVKEMEECERIDVVFAYSKSINDCL